MRLFVAVDLDAPMRERLRRLSAELRHATGDRLKATWVRADRMHLTLHFLGEVGDDLVPAVAAAVEAPVAVSPFDVEVAGVGLFPSAERPRVLWAGLRAGVAELVRVHAVMTERLAPLGIALDPRPFTPHLTLARIKGRVAPRASQAIAVCAGRAVGRCRVEAAMLYRSVLGEGGPTYTSLARAAFTGDA